MKGLSKLAREGREKLPRANQPFQFMHLNAIIRRVRIISKSITYWYYYT
jgi:hypothetical protein